MPENLEGESLALYSLQLGDRFMLTASTEATRGYTFVVNPLSNQEELVPLDGEFTVHPRVELMFLYNVGINFSLIRENNMGYIISSSLAVEKLD